MKSIIPTIRKECKGLNLSEWPLEYQEKFFNEVAQDIWKEKRKLLKELRRKR
jgi:Fe-S cluster biosynthesis and repair protein YggX